MRPPVKILTEADLRALVPLDAGAVACIRDACQPVLIAHARPGMRKGSAHGEEGGDRVDGEEGIVDDDEVAEPPLSRDGPGLVVVLAIVRVEQQYGDDVGRGENDGHLWLECEIEEILVNAERRAERWFWQRR